MEHLYSEPRDAGNLWREKQFHQVTRLIAKERRRATAERHAYFQPDVSSVAAYTRSTRKYRSAFFRMLGWPMHPTPGSVPALSVKQQLVAGDDLGPIYRLRIPTLHGVETYGLLFLPAAGEAPHPLIISQHGGGGTPELCAGFFGSENYRDMTRRVLRRGFAVFAPQLRCWREEFGPPNQRQAVDTQLKQLGGSIVALELYRLRRCLDYLQGRDDIDGSRVGMIGLSYGGFWTQMAAAADTRIGAALSSCYFNDRYVYANSDWRWVGQARRFLDAEIAGLICPRPLCVEVGRNDDLFDAAGARREIRRVREWYRAVGLSERLRFRVFDGTHELCRDDGNIEFLCRWVRGVAQTRE